MFWCKSYPGDLPLRFRRIVQSGRPVYYIYGKLLDDPGQSGAALLEDYCRAAFGEAAAPAMRTFYNTLIARLALYSSLEQNIENVTLLPRNPRVYLSASLGVCSSNYCYACILLKEVNVFVNVPLQLFNRVVMVEFFLIHAEKNDSATALSSGVSQIGE